MYVRIQSYGNAQRELTMLDIRGLNTGDIFWNVYIFVYMIIYILCVFKLKYILSGLKYYFLSLYLSILKLTLKDFR